MLTGLFQNQDQAEQDELQGQGFGVQDDKPGFFSGSMGGAARGLGQAGADSIGILAHGLSNYGIPEMTGMDKSELDSTQPYKFINESLDTVEQKARQFSKYLQPNPLVTGTGANLVQGFAKAVPEFIAGSLVAGPAGGAALLGSSEGYAHYQDLLDQGVDEHTARKSAEMTAVASGGSALLPMSLPAKIVGKLATPAALATQAAFGATVNVGLGAAQRYESAKILRDAGYPEMADQFHTWDTLSTSADAILGAFFGVHGGYHGIAAKDIDPSIRDAARVVLDRQESMDRAPGVPVDMTSMASHKQALEKSLGDLMAGKEVDLGDMGESTFARGEVDHSESARIIKEAFTDAGLLDDAEHFDGWLRGDHDEMAPTTPEVSRETTGPTPEPATGMTRMFHGGEPDPNAKDMSLWVTDSLDDAKGWADRHDTGVPGKIHFVDVPSDHPVFGLPEDRMPGMPPKSRLELPPELARQRQPFVEPGSHGPLVDRPDLKVIDSAGNEKPAADELVKADEAEAQANKEADTMMRAAVDCEARFA